jgi:hypothetical protein
LVEAEPKAEGTGIEQGSEDSRTLQMRCTSLLCPSGLFIISKHDLKDERDERDERDESLLS